jgi:hypothetical protein
MKTTTIFAIRCFIDGKRTKTHLLTKKQARIFRKTARHLSRYLKKTYKV